MTDESGTAADDTKEPVRRLTRQQRRVLGVLLEKGFTTPEQYPLTLKAATAGCNQKSNREPVTDYAEDDVLDVLEELRAMGLIAEVHTDGGRAARYRHYMRKHYEFSEPQLAILTELLLRGRQQLGELRTRASRMVNIPGQSELRQNLEALQAAGWIQTNGPLAKRGVEVDHTFYEPRDGDMRLASDIADVPRPAVTAAVAPARSPTTEKSPTAIQNNSSTDRASADAVEQLTRQVKSLEDTVSSLQSAIESLDDRLSRMERDLGV